MIVAARKPAVAHPKGSQVTAFRAPPERHWRSYGTDPLPTPAEALDQPFSAFPSWFLRIECDRSHLFFILV